MSPTQKLQSRQWLVQVLRNYASANTSYTYRSELRAAQWELPLYLVATYYVLKENREKIYSNREIYVSFFSLDAVIIERLIIHNAVGALFYYSNT